MGRLPMTVVIPVSSDKKIGRCIDSIDEDVEIVVVLNNNPTTEVMDIIRKSGRCKSMIVNEKGCNLARIFNKGIESATYSKVMLMNSDCTFQSGLIKKAYEQLDVYDVVKARVVFDHKNYRQRLVSQCRYLFHHVFQEGKKLFGPGLSFRKDIACGIGGYFFDENMGWGEDGELSKRIHSSFLKVLILSENIYHCEEGASHDLKVTFKIGKGNGIKERLEGFSLGESIAIDLKHFFTDHHNQFRLAYKNGGFLLLIYFFAWKIAFHLGYYKGFLAKEEKQC